ncbi:MAG: poly(R)-hydroxyalkanoic acid synthase subunit PhaE [Rubrimonas sp.]|uniref:poly(R)-hydroxyalkanoic acid synthase subunit PhaE n=1 Tax=Rubrimonas sp. TaxID=2036015 RepID=UPI002FDEB6D5
MDGGGENVNDQGASGVDALLKGWSEGWSALARAQAAAAEALAVEADDADALWGALQTQSALWRASAERASAAARSATGAETLARLLDPGCWLFAGEDAVDPALRRLIDGPPPSELAEMGRAGLPATQAWRALRRARAAHRRLVGAAWTRLVERAARAASADPPLAPERLQALWEAEAAAELDALHASGAFIVSQARLLAAAVALRDVETAMVEAWCESRALPTRREVDDLHRGLTELRRELRALKRELGRR